MEYEIIKTSNALYLEREDLRTIEDVRCWSEGKTVTIDFEKMVIIIHD